jgi:hypothetical protein
MNYRKRFVVEPGTKVRLDKIDPGFKDKHDESHYSATPEERTAWCVTCSPP